ncbi:MAG: BatA domain-containing protein [Phycisphaerae bacterium]
MPIMLLGTALAAIPLIIHLLHRRKTTPIEWSAMLFLQPSETTQKQKRIPEHWLLLILRMLLLALIAFLLSMPVLSDGGIAVIGRSSPADVVVVMDHSISTGFMSGRRTVFNHGILLLRSLIHHLSPGDSLNIVVAGHRNYSLSRRGILIADQTRIERRFILPLEQMPAGLSGSSIPSAIRYAQEVAQRGDNLKKVIFVISNDRVISWKIGRTGLWDSIRTASAGRPAPVYNIKIPAIVTESDVSIGPLHIEPRIPGIGQPAHIIFTVANSGPLSVSGVRLRLLVNGQPVAVTRIRKLGAGKTRTCRFKYRFHTGGSHWLEVRTHFQDALAADNRSLAAVKVWSHLSVLIIDHQVGSIGDYRDSRFLAAALDPFPQEQARPALATPEVVSISRAAQMHLRKFDAVILNDPSTVPGSLLTRLNLFARSGRGVWIIAGSYTHDHFLNTELQSHGLSVGTFGQLEKSRRPPFIVIRDRRSEIVKPLLQAGHNQIVGVTLRGWWALKPEINNTRIIAATGDGDPLIVKRDLGSSGGRLLVWTTGVGGQLNDWPTVAASFVPLVNQSVEHLALVGRELSSRRELNPGSMLVWTGPGPPPITSAELTLPDKRIIPLHPRLEPGDQYLITSSHTDEPGLYRLTLKPGSRKSPIYYCVAIDMRQLAPAELTAADMHWMQNRGFIAGSIRPDRAATILGTAVGGLSVWPLIAILVLVVMVVEGWLCRRLGRLQSDDQVIESESDIPSAASPAGAPW